MGFFATLFGKRSPVAAADDGIYQQVRCAACGAVVQVRIDPRNDLSLNDQADGYFVRKVLVDDRCYRRMTLEMTFDLSRRLTNSVVEGGTLIADA